MDAESDQARPPSTTFDLSAFVRGLTHEVANPLNAIAMNCELLRMITARGETAGLRDAVDRIMTACNRSGGLMRSLQRFGAALRVQPSVTLSARELIDAGVRALALEYSGTLPLVEVTGADTHVRVDRAAVERAITALLRNSAEAGSDRVEIEVSRHGSSVAIDIRDNGEGFVAEDRDKITAPFYSTHRTPTNMGLGLSLAREVTRVNGGSFEILHGAHGAHVRLSLPEAV